MPTAISIEYETIHEKKNIIYESSENHLVATIAKTPAAKLGRKMLRRPDDTVAPVARIAAMAAEPLSKKIPLYQGTWYLVSGPEVPQTMTRQSF